MKKINTLIKDMYEVYDPEHKGWDVNVSHFFTESMKEISDTRFRLPPRERGKLSFSQLGMVCPRKLYLNMNKEEVGEVLDPNVLNKFFYGDMIEVLALALAKAAGHSVEGMQDKMEFEGIKGSRDAVIDGMTVDVKSCSSYSFKKFKEGTLRDNDPFGYISQLSSYVAAGADDPLVTEKTKGAFLVVDKVTGEMWLDEHDFTIDVLNKKEEIQGIKDMVASPTPPPIIPDVQYMKSSNRTLAMPCVYCNHKSTCHPKLRAFKSYRGPVYLTKVNKEPRMEELVLNSTMDKLKGMKDKLK